MCVQSCLTTCNSMDCSLPGYSVHGIFQSIILEWVAKFPDKILADTEYNKEV